MKKVLALVFMGLLACDTLIASSLVGYWKFDEGEGEVAYDSSGNGNNGVLLNGVSWADGIDGYAVSFDGIDDYISIPDDPSLDVSGTGLTFSAWIYSPGFHDLGYIMGKADISGDWNDMAWWLLPRSSGAIRYAINSGGTTIERLDIPVGLTTDEWQHVAVVYDGSFMRFYHNGVVEDSFPKSGNLHVNNAPVIIGLDAWAPTSYYLGYMDEVRIYDRALSQDEISCLAKGCVDCQGCCRCGDVNGDGTANVGDAVFLINYVFKGGPAPDCR